MPRTYETFVEVIIFAEIVDHSCGSPSLSSQNIDPGNNWSYLRDFFSNALFKKRKCIEPIRGGGGGGGVAGGSHWQWIGIGSGNDSVLFTLYNLKIASSNLHDK